MLGLAIYENIDKEGDVLMFYSIVDSVFGICIYSQLKDSQMQCKRNVCVEIYAHTHLK